MDKNHSEINSFPHLIHIIQMKHVVIVLKRTQLLMINSIRKSLLLIINKNRYNNLDIKRSISVN